jgi:hypothetical protein
MHWRPPPVRNSPPLLSGVIGLGAIGLVLWLLVSLLGGSSGDSGSHSSAGGNNAHSAPIVVEKGDIPCQVSAYTNLTSDRLQTCVDAKKYAKSQLAAISQSNQWGCLDQLWDHESNWSAWAQNPNGGAYGIPQALGHGHPYDLGDWRAQVDWGLSYIKGRYKTPCAAWEWWQHPRAAPYDQNWY